MPYRQPEPKGRWDSVWKTEWAILREAQRARLPEASRSRAICSAKAAAVPPVATFPASRRRRRISGSRNATSNARFKRDTTCGGVRPGANNPKVEDRLAAGKPASASVGTPGSTVETRRCANCQGRQPPFPDVLELQLAGVRRQHLELPGERVGDLLTSALVRNVRDVDSARVAHPLHHPVTGRADTGRGPSHGPGLRSRRFDDGRQRVAPQARRSPGQARASPSRSSPASRPCPDRNPSDRPAEAIVSGLTAEKTSVRPSGGACLSDSMATTPPAPGRLSTITGVPSCSAARSASARAIASLTPAGGYATRMRTGPLGSEAACVVTAVTSNVHSISAATMRP